MYTYLRFAESKEADMEDKSRGVDQTGPVPWHFYTWIYGCEIQKNFKWWLTYWQIVRCHPKKE